ncbi:histidinol-phosphatase HisJ family protein [Bacillus andreraoultii]|uniref:histidinol-phosphatase HisJ family protein n=1 Tax=Bacillus andreraoultii TaxID=1499685 RepID=UPI00053BACC6|nr:histidinol-phosphatase HisJ family protein [Bacillus andreraoultii]
MFDYHVHSSFSEDCDIEMERMVQGAIDKGIQELCFTEHIDIDYPDPNWTFSLDLANYSAEIRNMQKIYGDVINIHMGVELGLQPHVLQDYKEFVHKEKFDFIICSMHATKGLDLHSGKFFEGKSLNQAYEEYYSELLTCIQSFKDFSILGHLDLVTRYKYEPGVQSFLDIIEEIFKVIIPNGQGIEINTSGFYYGIGRVMPSDDILKLYKEMGGEIITIGSDAHKQERLAAYYNHSIELLKNIGFTYVATFKNREPIFHKI